MMSKKAAQKSAISLLTFAALLHIVRSIAGWELVIGGWVVPVWLSIVVALLAACTAYHLWKGKK